MMTCCPFPAKFAFNAPFLPPGPFKLSMKSASTMLFQGLRKIQKESHSVVSTVRWHWSVTEKSKSTWVTPLSPMVKVQASCESIVWQSAPAVISIPFPFSMEELYDWQSELHVPCETVVHPATPYCPGYGS